MRSLHVVALVTGLALLTPRQAAAQDADRQGAGAGSGSGSGATSTTTATTGKGTYTVTQKLKAEQPEPPAGRWVRALTNVQVELTITDQSGTRAPEKKTVTMVVSSGSWGKIRSAGGVRLEPGMAPVSVDLNVDARPFVSVDGPIQLELTLAYSPLGGQGDDAARGKPPTVNQSLTVVLQNGKSLVISQAADPVGDRKIIVEARATILK